MFTVITLTLLFTILYYLVKVNYQYWEKRGIKGPKPTLVVGNFGKTFTFKASPGDIYAEAYRNFKNEQVVGLFRSFSPMLLVRDPEIIKEFVTSAFSSFHDNDIYVDKDRDPLFGRNPFVLKGEEWKSTRSKLTPAFTSGKMKWLYPYLENNSAKMVEFLKVRANGQPYETKELCARFTMNNVGDCVFGVEAKCFDDDNSELRQLANDFMSPGSLTFFVLMISFVVPTIIKLLPIRFVPKKVEDKMKVLSEESLSYRKKNKIVRNDMLEILDQLRQNSNGSFTDVDVVAHTGTFFTDAYETSSIAMSFMIYHLASNAEVQEELRKELEEAFEKNNNKLPYEVIQNLPYLDAVVNESLRIHPPANFLPKLCTKNYKLFLKEKNISVEIEKNTPVVISLWGLHNDPEFFEEPEKFKPERFLGDNKEKIKKGTFMPFGEGPRACLGQRFALLQMKVGLAYIAKNFKMSVNRKTIVPLQYDPSSVFITPIGGLWIDFEKI